MMENILKIGFTLIIIVFFYYQAIFLKWIWTNQIDAKATISRLFSKATPSSDIIVTRDSNKVYQNGQVVGIISGSVEIKDDILIFHELNETDKLDHNKPFEYKRDKYKIIQINSIIGTLSQVSHQGAVQKRAVLQKVTCKKIN